MSAEYSRNLARATRLLGELRQNAYKFAELLENAGQISAPFPGIEPDWVRDLDRANEYMRTALMDAMRRAEQRRCPEQEAIRVEQRR